jgi:FKBP-type peptidyl-prolyl cis-trans isomerase FklB
MNKYILGISIFFFGFIGFSQKKKDLIKEVASLKSQVKEMRAELEKIEKAKELDLKDSLQKFSYAYGLNIGGKLKSIGIDSISSNAFVMALEDAAKGNKRMEAKVAEDYISSTIKKIEDAENKVRNEQGISFLAKNENREEVITTESGLQYEILTKGDGTIPIASDKVKVHYTGMLIDGEVFDSSLEDGEPAVFGVTQVIKGWQEALQIMPVGSKWKVFIPQDLAYGERNIADGLIPPYSALIFEMELLAIEDK